MEEIDNKELKPWLRQRVAANLRRERLAKKVSQEKLSVDCGMHRTFISQIERAANNLTIDNLQRIADALGIDPSNLFLHSGTDEAVLKPRALRAKPTGEEKGKVG